MNDKLKELLEAEDCETPLDGLVFIVLVELVHEYKALETSAINNSGPEAQIEYLLSCGMTKKEILEAVKE